MNFWERGASNQDADKRSHISQSNQPKQNHTQSNADMMGEIARLNSLSEAERMAELMRTAGKMRAEGALDSGDLERIYQTARLFMTDDQLQRLRAIIDMVK